MQAICAWEHLQLMLLLMNLTNVFPVSQLQFPGDTMAVFSYSQIREILCLLSHKTTRKQQVLTIAFHFLLA